MRTLSLLDYSVIAAYIVFALGIGLYYSRRASQSVEHYFVSGRSLPWYLIGISMAATNLSIDTPLAITKYVFQEGIAGVWFYWSNAVTAVVATFLFARLWRRAEVITDNELIEKRYSGRAAAALRLFKGIYFGVIVNCFVMGWVFLALVKVMTGLTNLSVDKIIIIFTAITLLYTVTSGLYGVIMTDFFQYFLALGGSTLLAVLAIRDIGGIGPLVGKIGEMYGADSGITHFVPDFRSAATSLPLSVFLTYLLIQWWSHKYSDGGGKHIQRMSAAKGPRDSVYGTFTFTFMSYVVQVWPWIVTALVSLVLFKGIEDPEMSYPLLMAKVLPNGLLGLVTVGLLGAFMSTIDTHLNLGASYMINDIYRRFMVKNGSERHYVLMSRVAVCLNLLIAIVIGLNIKSVGEAWKFIMTFASGAGLVWILRWFWWRVNPWSEISAMLVSGIVASYLYLFHDGMLYSHKIWITVGFSSLLWLPITFLTSPTREETLIDFVKKVQPGYLGWKRIYEKFNLTPKPFLRRAAGECLVGIIFLFSLNFGIGYLILQNRPRGLGLLGVALVSFIVIIKGMRRVEERVL